MSSRARALIRLREYDVLCNMIESELLDSWELIEALSDRKNVALLSLLYVEHLIWKRGISFKELQEATLMNPSSLSKRLDQLMRVGLVRVEARPDRQRRKVYYLTDKGLELFEGKVMKKIADILKDFSEKLIQRIEDIREESILEG